jgi:membrane protease YdiL (CAAX protease family)
MHPTGGVDVKTSVVILLAALITEGLVTIVAWILWGLFEVELRWGEPLTSIILGLLWVLPLFIGNELLSLFIEQNPSSIFARFSKEVVTPLCEAVPPLLALILGILSGFGEELLFRAVLLPLFTPVTGVYGAILMSSILFAWVHFIGQERKYGALIPLYTLVGVYFSIIFLLHGTALPVMICHGTYNFMVILRTRSKSIKE